MDIPPRPEDDGSIDDLNIDNRNNILKRSQEVVHICMDLGMTFSESEDKLCALAERILRKD